LLDELKQYAAVGIGQDLTGAKALVPRHAAQSFEETAFRRESTPYTLPRAWRLIPSIFSGYDHTTTFVPSGSAGSNGR